MNRGLRWIGLGVDAGSATASEPGAAIAFAGRAHLGVGALGAAVAAVPRIAARIATDGAAERLEETAARRIPISEARVIEGWHGDQGRSNEWSGLPSGDFKQGLALILTGADANEGARELGLDGSAAHTWNL